MSRLPSRPPACRVIVAHPWAQRCAEAGPPAGLTDGIYARASSVSGRFRTCLGTGWRGLPSGGHAETIPAPRGPAVDPPRAKGVTPRRGGGGGIMPLDLWATRARTFWRSGAGPAVYQPIDTRAGNP